MFALDSSGSLGVDNWRKVLQFAKTFIGDLYVGEQDMRIGVVSYGSKAKVAFHLNEYYTHNQLYSAIDRIPWLDQETNTSGAIRTMHKEMFTQARGDRPQVANVGIVITDGESNVDKDLTILEANKSRKAGQMTLTTPCP